MLPPHWPCVGVYLYSNCLFTTLRSRQLIYSTKHRETPPVVKPIKMAMKEREQQIPAALYFQAGNVTLNVHFSTRFAVDCRPLVARRTGTGVPVHHYIIIYSLPGLYSKLDTAKPQNFSKVTGGHSYIKQTCRQQRLFQLSQRGGKQNSFGAMSWVYSFIGLQSALR